MEKPSLADRRILITGAASGIGRRLAEELFLGARARLVLADLDGPGLEALRAELLTKADGDVTTVTIDVAAPDAARRLAAVLGDSPLDALVNNAGVTHIGTFERTSLGDFERVVAVNLLGAVAVTHAVLPRLLASGRAAIVNVSSGAGLLGLGGMAAYSAAKAGLIAFSEALRAELRGRATVSVVCPGFVKTGIASRALVPQGAADAQRAAMEHVLATRGVDAGLVTRAIRAALVGKGGVKVIGVETRVLHFTKRLSPAAAEGLAAWAYRDLVKKGVIAS